MIKLPVMVSSHSLANQNHFVKYKKISWFGILSNTCRKSIVRFLEKKVLLKTSPVLTGGFLHFTILACDFGKVEKEIKIEIEIHILLTKFKC